MKRRKPRWMRIIAAGLIVGAVVLTTGYMTKAPDIKTTGYVIHVVKPGETLWDIASKYNDNTKRDVRNLIQDIKHDNNLKANAYLQVGQELRIAIKRVE